MFYTVVLPVGLAILFMLFLIWTGKSTPGQRAPFYGRNFAHRGLHTPNKKTPENSLAAFEAACLAGYGIELDIQLTKEGEVVVFHDDDLKRVCGVEGRVDSFLLEELQQMRLEGTSQTIPLFAEVLALVDKRVPLIVELKTGPRNTLLCQKALEILNGYEGDFCIESFDPRIVGWFKKNAKHILRGQLAAAPSQLKNGITGFIVGTLLCNFLGRPQFIAYGIGKVPFTASWAQTAAMKVCWTARPSNNTEELQANNDAVIFEFYNPEPQYKTQQKPEEAPPETEKINNPTDEA
ncbi:glycerophosphodiester phosphodiesterase [Ruminococcaceae bacterium OttesenSCG-928-A16]|nr:glycerophosphodiester phosphodiesterase [Ruminococcaceae bacterium OttesenSCG-928-A16]